MFKFSNNVSALSLIHIKYDADQRGKKMIKPIIVFNIQLEKKC